MRSVPPVELLGEQWYNLYVAISTKVDNMTVELPADVHALRMEIARASLTRSFQVAFNEDPPDYIICNPGQIKRAEQEWCKHYMPQITLLAKVSQQALSRLNEQGLEVAIVSFTSSVITQPELNRFMHANLYLEELVAGTCRDADLFRSLLALLVDLGNLKH